MPDNQRNSNQGPGKDRGPDDKFEWKRAARTLSFWILLIVIVIVLTSQFSPDREEALEISYTTYRVLLEDGAFDKIIITERKLTGTLNSEYLSSLREQMHPDDLSQVNPSQSFTQFDNGIQVVLPFVDQGMVEEWENLQLDVEFREEKTNFWGVVLTSILPWVIIIGFWIFLLRRMQGGGTRGIFSFGKSRAKLMIENKPKVTFEDVAGGDEAKEELQEIIQFLKEPKKFQRLGGRIPKGALLIGPPGTGKTLLGRAIAGEAGVPFFSMSGADFVEMFVGVGASRVRDLFEQGKKHAPCIIFIDEIDAVGRQRGAGLGGGHDEREQTLNQLLVEMDGFESNDGVILIAATNRPDVLDPALLRPGRFDRQIVVDRPDVRGREGILRVHTRNIPIADDVELKILAKGTPGLSGADLANMANEAALLAARRDGDKVTMRDFEDAKDKVMMGAERKSILISDEEKKLTAYHEAGHVLVAIFTPGSDPVHKVTIIPRGRALGVTHYLPIDEKHSWSKQYIEGKLIHLAGGRAAERLIFDDYTNGAAQDIRQATDIARKMVCDWGMSDKVGPLSLGQRQEEIFLGREISQHRDYSEATALEIDREVKRIILSAQKTAEQLLAENIQKLHDVANALLEREILDGEDIELIMEGKPLPPVERKKKSQTRRTRRYSSRRKTSSSSEKPDTRLKKVDEALAKIDELDSDSGQQHSTTRSSTTQTSRTTTRRPSTRPKTGSRTRSTTTRPQGGRTTRPRSTPRRPQKPPESSTGSKNTPDSKPDSDDSKE